MKWSYLFRKYMAGQLSCGEKQEFDRQRAACQWKQEDYMRVSDPDCFIQALREHMAADIDQGWLRLCASLGLPGSGDMRKS